MSELVDELKTLIIEVLNLEDITPEDIIADESLFGEGLGLDSIDALELGLALQKKYNISIDAENKETKSHFASVNSLAKFVSDSRA
ncbi:phosphopantetheine-binding protein [Microbulbifer variabilis]|uniref:phosphopantetheine-binding protein n=1 Tax=Microbulbifer variabilis TaxID=266805 RepID=UPI001CFF00BF|nr:phosphopantetheine-binding protein [Microbulbifer variabilis]